MSGDEAAQDELWVAQDELPTASERLTAAKAAARLGVTKAWVSRLIKDGRLPAVKRSSPIGDYWEVQAADLDQVRGLKRTGRPPKKVTEQGKTK